MMEKRAKIKFILENWQDEKQTAYFYRWMAKQEKIKEKREKYLELAETEETHASIWEKEMEKLGLKIPQFRLTLRGRILLFFASILGYRSLIPILENGEDNAVLGYTQGYRESDDEKLKESLKEIIPDERRHSLQMQEYSGIITKEPKKERWHRGGESIGDIIFGVNDGLLSTFSLVMGVSGAVTNNSYILLSGLAGAIAGAISMAAGAYISTKSTLEVYHKHLKTEKMEMEMFPEEEKRELVAHYLTKGIPETQANILAEHLFKDKKTALESMTKEELGFAVNILPNPYKAALSEGIAFVCGAALPILPYLLIPGYWATKVCIILSLSGFFIAGAGRIIVTGRNPLISGLEMFFLGAGAALITYFIGSLIGVSL